MQRSLEQTRCADQRLKRSCTSASHHGTECHRGHCHVPAEICFMRKGKQRQLLMESSLPSRGKKKIAKRMRTRNGRRNRHQGTRRSPHSHLKKMSPEGETVENQS
ncbi:hypothetical protein AVEN_57104-1 [Araneus ventricosus]|uniref:Uncharacterized protein n=1 Tax=Araneus ventricosus TaxID=182803 RepID=A0A4Y2PFT4_ARAVE|nr:hypothetical protein AVEN_57104-1 [Araneus ventricosus]